MSELLIRNIVFPLHAAREKNGMPLVLRELERSQYLSSRKIKELQLRRLRKLLVHAGSSCPFYKRRFREAGFDPGRFQSLDDLRIIPLLTKADIQKHSGDMKTQGLPEDMIVPDKTGGSTGRPLHFFLDRERVFSRNAAAIRHDRWTGWDIGEKSAYLWGHREDIEGAENWKSRLRNVLLDRRVILDTSSMTSGKFREFNGRLKSFRPSLYVAYANSIFLFARYLKETKSSDHHRPRAIITSAELLESQQRALIEEVFACPVFDRYGSRETSIIASECDRHEGLHICAEALYIEFEKAGKPASPGEPGKIIITDLLNYGMPFIRYRIEDVGMAIDGECSCGRGLPMMKMAGGRMTDFLVTPEGKMISGASLTIYLIANAPGVAQAQLIQEKKDEVVIRLVKGDGFGDDSMRFFERELPLFFGKSVKFELEFVDEIPLEPSGKYRFSISKVDPAEMF